MKIVKRGSKMWYIKGTGPNSYKMKGQGEIYLRVVRMFW